MKRIAIIVAIVVVLSALGGTVYAAQDSLPGDTLYSVKLGVEDATMMLSGDDVARAERALNFAAKRVREMLTLTERERLGDLGVSADKYCCAMNMSLVRMEAALRNGGSDADDITQLMAEAMVRHVSVLDGVYNVTPDEAKPAMTRAMEQALTCYQTAIQVRERLRLQVSGLPTIPSTIQERVEQRIQEHAGAGQSGSGQGGPGQ
ncbi:MAG: DUF5667 domain-containing protein [Dehalococcoidia bacterium]|nr:DUF5667 domain-containing protein [Dehalococcoidia bacterium]MDH4291651.1 DUF5667 domain-containing protein [Dehalococcoidia bacterium]